MDERDCEYGKQEEAESPEFEVERAIRGDCHRGDAIEQAKGNKINDYASSADAPGVSLFSCCSS